MRPDAVDLAVGRQESTNPQTDAQTAGFFTAKTLTYTRAEAQELLQEQPGDPQHAKLVEVLR